LANSDKEIEENEAINKENDKNWADAKSRYIELKKLEGEMEDQLTVEK